jgi:hypothetical protein
MKIDERQKKEEEVRKNAQQARKQFLLRKNFKLHYD